MLPELYMVVFEERNTNPNSLKFWYSTWIGMGATPRNLKDYNVVGVVTSDYLKGPAYFFNPALFTDAKTAHSEADANNLDSTSKAFGKKPYVITVRDFWERFSYKVPT